MKEPYLLIGLIFLVSFFYFVTWSLYRLQIIQKSLHNKLWNVVLLITFLVAGLLGLFMAAQINYKWEIEIIDKITNWHVNFGIAMAMVSIFHFIWHWSYYVNLFKHKSETNYQNNIADYKDSYSSQKIKLLLRMLGFSTAIIQLVLLREFLAVLDGNELVIGLVLSLWMTFIGLGALLSKRAKNISANKIKLENLIIYISAFALLDILSIYLFKNLVFISGSVVSLWQMISAISILLWPVCMLSGYTFNQLANQYSKIHQLNFAAKSYGIEATGSIIGGVIFNFILAYWLQSIEIIFLVLLLAIIIRASIFEQFSKAKIISASIVFLMLFFSIFKYGDALKEILYHHHEIIYNKDTPYGNIVITKNAEQLNFFENSTLLFSTENIIENEEVVHYCLLQVDKPKKVLLVSGGIKGLVKEIEKYPVEQVDYVEINPWLIKAGKKFTNNLDSKRLKIYAKNPIVYLKNSQTKYDAVIIDVPAPVNVSLNRYYTAEFYQLIKNHLAPGACIITKMPATYNYVSQTANKEQSTILNTLQRVFSNVIILPGENNYFLAAEKPLNTQIAYLSSIKNITTDYVNEYYIDDFSMKERSRYILNMLKTSTDLNTNNRPVAYFYHIVNWLSYYNSKSSPLIILLAVVLLLFFMFLQPINLGLFTTGFTSASAEFILIFLFQIYFGYVYQMMGIIIMFFMIGLFMGSIYNKKFIKKVSLNSYKYGQLYLAGLVLIILLLFFILENINMANFVIVLAIVIMAVTLGTLVGIQYYLATKLQKSDVLILSANSYSTEILGSALGILITSIFLIPLLGLMQSLIILILLNIITVILIQYKK